MIILKRAQSGKPTQSGYLSRPISEKIVHICFHTVMDLYATEYGHLEYFWQMLAIFKYT